MGIRGTDAGFIQVLRFSLVTTIPPTVRIHSVWFQQLTTSLTDALCTLKVKLSQVETAVRFVLVLRLLRCSLTSLHTDLHSSLSS